MLFDTAYYAWPAAGIDGSVTIEEAGTLTDGLEIQHEDFELAFYD